VLPDLYFAVPGDLNTLTGGYGYDRRVLAGLSALGLVAEHVPLSSAFPQPDAAALAAADARLAAVPDGAVVLVDGLAFGVMDTLAAKHGKRLRLIGLCHHPLALEAGLGSAEAERLQQSEQRALAAAVAVVVNSAATAAVLLRDYGVPQSKLTIALPGTDRQTFAACSGNPPVLLTVATLTRRKAHDVLLAALAQLAHLPWVARLVGGADFDPPWAEGLRQQATALGLQQRIEFVGSLADLRPEYAQADLFVLPTLYEGYGMVFAEALAFGLPIVATRVGAVPDVVPETAGMLVAPADIAALTAALKTLLAADTGPAQRKRLQHGAQAAALQLPTWAATAQAVADLINTVRTR